MFKRIVLMLLCALLPLTAMAQSLSDYLSDEVQNRVGTQVIDDAGALSAQEEERIAAVIERIERDHHVDIVVLVTYDVPYDGSEERYIVQRYADDFFDYGNYGMGPDNSGMLYLIDLHNRVQYISTGGVMIDYITDQREEAIFDAAEPWLYGSEWGGAALAAMERTEAFMAEGRQRGFFRYDEATGQRISGFYNPLEPFEVLIALGGGVLAGAVMTGSIGASYGLKFDTYKYDMNGNAAYKLTRDDERYLRESVSRVARGSSSSGSGSGGRRISGGGGSGVHRSSSGRSHGGGGRRF